MHHQVHWTCSSLNLKIVAKSTARAPYLCRAAAASRPRRIYSHPQSFAQTSSWLRSHLPKVEKIPVSSNAEGARRARNSDDAAAIAGESAGHVYGLKKVIMSPIQDDADNTTRFLVIGRSIFPASGHDRTSVLVFIHDKPGALFDVLSPFARHGISMNRIESRPSHNAKWEYGFFIDLAGHIEDEAMKKRLRTEAHSAQTSSWLLSVAVRRRWAGTGWVVYEGRELQEDGIPRQIRFAPRFELAHRRVRASMVSGGDDNRPPRHLLAMGFASNASRRGVCEWGGRDGLRARRPLDCGTRAPACAVGGTLCASKSTRGSRASLRDVLRR